ncbi:unnamed protein product, partial [Brassica rapa subsp. narinosa]
DESRAHLFFQLCKILLHAVCYILWRERNLRLHNSSSRSVQLLIREIQVVKENYILGIETLHKINAQHDLKPSSNPTLLFGFAISS